MTYSLVARDPATGDLGVAVQSHFFGVGRLVPWAQAGVGVVATQSFVEPAYGSGGLAAMAAGRTPAEALADLIAADAGSAVRQVAMLDAAGRVAVHTGDGCIPAAGHRVGEGVSAQANLVESSAVWDAMVEAFARAEGDLARRMLAALVAAEERGGDIRGRQAAALVVVRGVATGRLVDDRVVDVRVDDHPDPLGELARLVDAGEAMAGLLRMLEAEGLLGGEMRASDAEVRESLAELERAQETLGEGNLEPTVWRGLLLARAGRADEARAAFRRAAAADPRAPELVRRLGAAGMWVRAPDELDALLPGAPRPGSADE